jgi:hypothetical protein
LAKSLRLAELYYEPTSQGSFRGVKALLTAARAKGYKDVSRADCTEFLAAQPTYTIFRPSRRNFPHSRIHAYFTGEIVQIDIADFQKYRAENDGYAYALLAQDTYSKLLQCVPLRDRKPPGIIQGLRAFLAGPIGISKIYWDREGSFLSRSSNIST